MVVDIPFMPFLSGFAINPLVILIFGLALAVIGILLGGIKFFRQFIGAYLLVTGVLMLINSLISIFI